MKTPEQFKCCRCGSVSNAGKQYLPSMQIFVCSECIRDKNENPISLNQVTNLLVAPWDSEQVKSLQGYQFSNQYIQFVCNDGHRMKAEPLGLRCDKCDERQAWSYNWTLDWSWDESDPSDPDPSGVPKKPIPPTKGTGVKLDLPDKDG